MGRRRDRRSVTIEVAGLRFVIRLVRHRRCDGRNKRCALDESGATEGIGLVNAVLIDAAERADVLGEEERFKHERNAVRVNVVAALLRERFHY